MDKRYIILPRWLFGRVICGDGKGNLVVRCPNCLRHVSTRAFWTETGLLAREPATLSFVECLDCAIRMYPDGGAFTTPDSELRRAREEVARASRQVAKWGRWTDKPTSQETGRLKTAVERKLQAMGLGSHRMALLLAKTMQLPHVTAYGRFHKPEIYTVRDVEKLDALWDMLENPLPFAPSIPTDEQATAAWRRQQGEPADVQKCDLQPPDHVK